jgi:hypothetical protein
MKILRDPLAHFVIVGVVLFVVWTIVGDRLESDATRRIEITASDIELLSQTFQRQWQRPPIATELENLVQARIREEVLYREALALGLDQNDMVVRRRMVQKMEMLSQDLALLVDPTDAELEAFYREHSDQYRFPPKLSFSQVYFNRDRRGSAADADARALLAELRARRPAVTRAPERGDRFMLGHDFAAKTPAEVEREFGSGFARTLFELEPGWQGPIESGYGLHLVHVGERTAGREPAMSEIRDRLLLDFNRQRRDRADRALLEGLLDRYEVVVEDS